jgi:hypothetical protein
LEPAGADPDDYLKGEKTTFKPVGTGHNEDIYGAKNADF